MPPEHAILVPLMEHDGVPSLILFRRPESPKDPYSGQMCFPGGRREVEDESLVSCALRETEEELGLARTRIEVFAELEFQRTLIHRRVKPYAGTVDANSQIRSNPAEVASVHFLPLSRVRPELFEVRETRVFEDGQSHTLWRFDLDGHEVWGLTAKILRSFALDSAEFQERIARNKPK